MANQIFYIFYSTLSLATITMYPRNLLARLKANRTSKKKEKTKLAHGHAGNGTRPRPS